MEKLGVRHFSIRLRSPAHFLLKNPASYEKKCLIEARLQEAEAPRLQRKGEARAQEWEGHLQLQHPVGSRWSGFGSGPVVSSGRVSTHLLSQDKSGF